MYLLSIEVQGRISASHFGVIDLLNRNEDETQCLVRD